MLVVYATVAGLGYYYFGNAASTLITDDLATNSPFTGHWVRCHFAPLDEHIIICIPYIVYGICGSTHICCRCMQNIHNLSCGPLLDSYHFSLESAAADGESLKLSVTNGFSHQAASMQILFRGLTVDHLVSTCILVNAYTTYPCLVLVIQVLRE